jgi:hypothetical protein
MPLSPLALLLALVACARAAGEAAGEGERYLLRAGESRTIELPASPTDEAGLPPLVAVCFEGSSPLRAWLVWHRAELRFVSSAAASSFEFESSSSSTDDLPALVHGLATVAYLAQGSQPLEHVAWFSPYGTSCVGVRALGSSSSWVSSGSRLVVVNARSHFVWHLPLRLLLGAALIACAASWCEREGFYYLGGSSLGVLFGVVLVGVFVINRLFTRRWSRLSASFLFLTGYIGSLTNTLSSSAAALALRYSVWLYVYLAVCATLGLAYVHRTVRSECGVPAWCRDLTRWALRACGVLLVLTSTYSTRLMATAALLGALAAGALALMPDELRTALWAACFETKPAPRPATTFLASGAFMSEEEFQMQAQIETDRALRELHSSPAFQRWLMANHRRLSTASLAEE